MQSETSAKVRETRLSTGVPGLDEVLRGGLPPNHVYLLEGDPGTGKTTLAVQFLLAGAAEGEQGVLLALSESRTELNAIAAEHGWSLDPLKIIEFVPSEANLDQDESYTFFHSEEVELAGTIKALIAEIEQAKAARVVIDSLAELRLLAQDPRGYRRQVLALKQHFANKAVTLILLDDRTSSDTQKDLHSVVHGVISLERLTREYGKNRRRLEVAKMRGSAFTEGFHDYIIEPGGLRVFPRLVASEHHAQFVREGMTTGIDELDSLLGGGMDRGSSTLLVGPAGSGKSTLALKYAGAAAARGEPVALYSFEESLQSMLDRTEAVGIGLREHVESGRVVVKQIDPAESSPGEFAAEVRYAVEHLKVRVVMIDSLNGYLAAMPEEQFLTLQMHELLSYLNQQGVVTILILAQQGVLQPQAGIDVSYLADTIVLLRFFEAHGRVRKAVSVLKKRTSKHEQMIRELEIGPPAGLRVGVPLSDFHGVLTGVPQYLGRDGFQQTMATMNDGADEQR
jgi:circadian clock protein KaiC